MRWEERQKRVEDSTYNSLEMIAEEIRITPLFYPEVYWIGRKLKFEELGLSYKYKKDFDFLRKNKKGGYLVKPEIILIGGYFLEDIGEEAGHFLHLTNSNMGRRNIEDINGFCLNSIIEMFGFFCSKLIKPSRKNSFKRYKDYLPKKVKSGGIVQEKINSFSSLEHKYEVISEVYQQGYGLGEELFNAYVSNSFPKEKIKKLFTNPLTKKDEPFSTFLGLKYDMIRFMKNY